MKKKTLVSILGPTCIGKSKTAIKIAQHFKTEIISSDSRQCYKHMDIGTAKPSLEERKQINHHLIDFIELDKIYSAGQFQKDAIKILKNIWQKKDIAILCGGSNLYINALCNGIDNIPNVRFDIKQNVNSDLENHGLKYLLNYLKVEDIEYYNIVDKQNKRRITRAVEVIRQTNQPFSNFRKNNINYKPNFRLIQIQLDLERDTLYENINKRVDQMIQMGLIEEVLSLSKYRHCYSMDTIGYREIFEFLDKKIKKSEAIDFIKRNTRRYAKRQMTWLRKIEDKKKFNPNDTKEIIKYLELIL